MRSIHRLPSAAVAVLGRLHAVALACVLALAAGEVPSQAQEMSVPVGLQVPLFLKVLNFDRNLTARAGPELVLGVLFQTRHRESLNARKGFSEAFSSAGLAVVSGLPTRYVEIDLEREEDLAGALQREQVDVLYVSPLRAVSLDQIAQTTQAAGIMTLSGLQEYVESGLMVGVTERGGRPSLMVNLEAARAANVDFEAAFLKVARVLRH